MSAPVAGSWHRWAVIRGDLATLSFLAALGGLGAAAAGVTGHAPAVPAAAVGAAGVALGGVGLVHARRAWRALLEDVVARWATHDPGQSPHPFLSDAVWRETQGFTPALDAPLILRAEVDRDLRVFPDDRGPAVLDPLLRVVAAEERSVAPRADLSSPPPTAGDLVALGQALAGVEARFIVLSPRWPVCCGVLTRLMSRTLDRAPALWLGEPGVADPERRGPHRYTCGVCGASYTTDPAW